MGWDPQEFADAARELLLAIFPGPEHERVVREEVTIEAKGRVRLVCGDSSISLEKEGRIQVRGKDVLTRGSRTARHVPRGSAPTRASPDPARGASTRASRACYTSIVAGGGRAASLEGSGPCRTRRRVPCGGTAHVAARRDRASPPPTRKESEHAGRTHSAARASDRTGRRAAEVSLTSMASGTSWSSSKRA